VTKEPVPKQSKTPSKCTLSLKSSCHLLLGVVYLKNNKMENFIFTTASIALIMLGVAVSNLLYWNVKNKIREDVLVNKDDLAEIEHRIKVLARHINELEIEITKLKRGKCEEVPEWGRITQQDIEWG
jgi:hypothetical protein